MLKNYTIQLPTKADDVELYDECNGHVWFNYLDDSYKSLQIDFKIEGEDVIIPTHVWIGGQEKFELTDVPFFQQWVENTIADYTDRILRLKNSN